MTSPGIVLLLVAWTPSAEWHKALSEAAKGLEVLTYEVDISAEHAPQEITDDIWDNVRVLLTWKCWPPADKKMPRLEYVQLMSAGCNHVVDNPLFRDTKIAFCTANGVHRGILGYGCIGRQCARVAKAFGMDVIAYTLHERKTAEDRKDDSYVEKGLGDPDGTLPSKWYHGKDQLNDFLGADLDLLVILLPLTNLTKGMIARQQFEILSKRQAYVCNAGRGPIVDTADLIRALDEGQIRGAALDVTDPEPLPSDHPLWKAKNVIVTPHVSGNSVAYNDRVMAILRQNLIRMNSGKALINVVDRRLGY